MTLCALLLCALGGSLPPGMLHHAALFLPPYYAYRTVFDPRLDAFVPAGYAPVPPSHHHTTHHHALLPHVDAHLLLPRTYYEDIPLPYPRVALSMALCHSFLLCCPGRSCVVGSAYATLPISIHTDRASLMGCLLLSSLFTVGRRAKRRGLSGFSACHFCDTLLVRRCLSQVLM